MNDLNVRILELIDTVYRLLSIGHGSFYNHRRSSILNKLFFVECSG